MDSEKVVGSVQTWVSILIVGMNLCPFARREIVKNRVRIVASGAATEEQLLLVLQDELVMLNADPSVETTLLIHPDVLQVFDDYNQFLYYADALLVEMDLEGVYQIASFHPDYQFDGTRHEDAENYTNRSPYPLLHILREASLERAIAGYPDIDQIPIRNIALMNELGAEQLQTMLQGCNSDSNIP